jgi:DNA polymerase
MALELDTRQRAMLQEMGVHVWLPESGVAVLEQAAPSVQSARPVAQALGTPTPTRAPAAPLPARSPAPVLAVAPGSATVPAERASTASLDWPTLADSVRSCQACGLCAGRNLTTLLPPTDQATCDWMVLGDAPDEDEDRAGAPFAGQDGVLLGHMLRALGLQRANPLPSTEASPVALPRPAAQRAYVSNVLKCRPTHGALAQAAELAACAAHLQQEIALVQPKMILAMGRFANQALLAASPALAAQPLGKLRGTLHRFQGIPVVVTYPPKLLMRNSADKAKAWADLCLAAATLSTEPPP